jgi:hypothetical protein
VDWAAGSASATPAPAYSAQVYQVILPTLVLIQTHGGGFGFGGGGGLGGGFGGGGGSFRRLPLLDETALQGIADLTGGAY